MTIPSEPSTEGVRGAGTLLVVEDESELLADMVEYLELSGYSVLPASDGLAALQVLRQASNIIVVVSDLRMPEMDGFALAGEIVLRTVPGHEIEVVLLSGHMGFSDEARAASLSVFACLPKPCALRQLADTIDQAMLSALRRRKASIVAGA